MTFDMLSVAPVFAMILLGLGVSLPFMIRPERESRYRM
jgi:hypothetical protein